jgi:hypothetical protein
MQSDWQSQRLCHPFMSWRLLPRAQTRPLWKVSLGGEARAYAAALVDTRQLGPVFYLHIRNKMQCICMRRASAIEPRRVPVFFQKLLEIAGARGGRPRRVSASSAAAPIQASRIHVHYADMHHRMRRDGQPAWTSSMRIVGYPDKNPRPCPDRRAVYQLNVFAESGADDERRCNRADATWGACVAHRCDMRRVMSRNHLTPRGNV